jgi:SAM-dependent methyltransferase
VGSGPLKHGSHVYNSHNYRGSGYYGAYPPDYLERVWALFPDKRGKRVLHCFSGSLPVGTYGLRVDIKFNTIGSVRPDIQADAQALPFVEAAFDLVLADTPYGPFHARRYGTRMPVRAVVMRELARVTARGGFLVWLDTKLPMFRKTDWYWCGAVQVIRSTNHDYRGAAIFQRVSAAEVVNDYLALSLS